MSELQRKHYTPEQISSNKKVSRTFREDVSDKRSVLMKGLRDRVYSERVSERYKRGLGWGIGRTAR